MGFVPSVPIYGPAYAERAGGLFRHAYDLDLLMRRWPGPLSNGQVLQLLRGVDLWAHGFRDRYGRDLAPALFVGSRPAYGVNLNAVPPS